MAKSPEKIGQDRAARGDPAPRKHRRRSVVKKASAEPKREPTEREAALIAASRAAHALRPIRAEIEKREPLQSGALAIGPRHCDDMGGSYTLVDAFATTSEAFTTESLLQLAEMSIRDGEVNNDKINAKLALLGAISPQNELEAALALEMIATHDLSLLMINRAKTASHIDAMREYGNLATKLSRTFAAQMKTLSDWRRGGEQVVRHVHVYEGGRAVVAETVNVGGPNNAIMPVQPYGPCAALPGPNPAGDAMPVAGGSGAEAVPAPRRSQGVGGSAG